jgi:hypothetical protein
MLNSSVTPLSRQTISRDISENYKVAQAMVSKYLQELNCMLSLGIDGWTSPQATGYVAVLVHFTEGTQMKKIILDFAR